MCGAAAEREKSTGGNRRNLIRLLLQGKLKGDDLAHFTVEADSSHEIGTPAREDNAGNHLTLAAEPKKRSPGKDFHAINAKLAVTPRSVVMKSKRELVRLCLSCTLSYLLCREKCMISTLNSCVRSTANFFVTGKRSGKQRTKRSLMLSAGCILPSLCVYVLAHTQEYCTYCRNCSFSSRNGKTSSLPNSMHCCSIGSRLLRLALE